MNIYKYLKKEHLEAFKAKGTICMNTLYSLRAAEQKTIRDELEGRNKLLIGSETDSLVLSADELHTLNPKFIGAKNVMIEIEKGGFLNNIADVRDSFVFCTSLSFDERLRDWFECDAHYKITDPYRFAEILYFKLTEIVPIIGYDLRAVKYADKEATIESRNDLGKAHPSNDFWDACFTKPKVFSFQKEFRMVFVPEGTLAIQPRILDCPELRNYVEV